MKQKKNENEKKTNFFLSISSSKKKKMKKEEEQKTKQRPLWKRKIGKIFEICKYMHYFVFHDFIVMKKNWKTKKIKIRGSRMNKNKYNNDVW